MSVIYLLMEILENIVGGPKPFWPNMLNSRPEDQGHINSSFSMQKHYITSFVSCVGFQFMEVKGKKDIGWE